MRRFLLLALLLIALSAFSAAQGPSGNVFFGYTYYNTDLSLNRGSLNGWEGSLEGKLFPLLGVVTDLTGHYGSLNFPTACVGPGPCPTLNASAHIYQAMFGPRLSVPVGKFRPFGEFELGVAHATTHGFGSDTSFATAAGGGLDYHLAPLVALRFQADSSALASSAPIRTTSACRLASSSISSRRINKKTRIQLVG